MLLSELKNHFASTLRSAQAQMYAEVTHRGWFRDSPQQQRRVWQGIGTGLVVLGVASGWFLGFRSAGTDQVGGISLGVPSGIVLAAGLVRGRAGRAAARQADGRAHRATAAPSWPSRSGSSSTS